MRRINLKIGLTSKEIIYKWERFDFDLIYKSEVPNLNICLLFSSEDKTLIFVYRFILPIESYDGKVEGRQEQVGYPCCSGVSTELNAVYRTVNGIGLMKWSRDAALLLLVREQLWSPCLRLKSQEESTFFYITNPPRTHTSEHNTTLLTLKKNIYKKKKILVNVYQNQYSGRPIGKVTVIPNPIERNNSFKIECQLDLCPPLITSFR